MAVSSQAQEFLDIVAGGPPLDTQTVAQNRADLAQAMPLTGEPTTVAEVRDTTMAGSAGDIPVRVYVPATQHSGPRPPCSTAPPTSASRSTPSGSRWPVTPPVATLPR